MVFEFIHAMKYKERMELVSNSYRNSFGIYLFSPGISRSQSVYTRVYYSLKMCAKKYCTVDDDLFLSNSII